MAANVIHFPPQMFTRYVAVSDSTNIVAVWYNPLTDKMKIQFSNKREYLYHDVPSNIFANIVSSDSPGQAFNKMRLYLKDFEEV